MDSKELQDGSVSLILPTAAACGSDVSDLQLEGNDGSTNYVISLGANIDYNSCNTNAGSSLSDNNPFSGVTKLLVGGGLSFFAARASNGAQPEATYQATQTF